MKKLSKRIVSFLLAAVMMMSVGTTVDLTLSVKAASVKQQIASATRQRYTGFKKIKSGTYYFTKGKLVKGIKKISGKKYYFSASGKMAKKKLVTYKKNKYYFDKKGVMVSKKLVTVNGKKYYLTKNGKAKRSGFQKVNGKTYYFKASGVNKTGILNLNGKRYYFDKKGVMKTGIISVSDKKYYFASKGKVYNGFVTVDGKKYYILPAGNVQTGLQTINGKRYYFNGSGAMKTGFQIIGGRQYYFNPETGVMQTGFVRINSMQYYFNADGIMQTGYTWADGKLYFIEMNGQIFTASSLKGWYGEGSSRSYYTENGVQLKNMVMKIDGLIYGFSADGIMLTGFAKIGADTYCFDPETGGALIGWQKLEDKTYHFRDGGELDINLFKVGVNLFYSDDNGVLQNDGSGKIVIFEIEHKQMENGAIADIWFTDANGSTYYFKEDANMATGTVVIDSFKYYFEQDGRLYGDNLKRKGIDVSYHNGSLDWKKIKAAGVEFAMLRAGYGMELNQKDKLFEENYKNAKAVGMPVGAYIYSYATTVKEAKKEAEVMKKWLVGKSFEYPIAFDIEDEKWQGRTKLTNKQRTDIVEAFCKEMEDAGYYVVVYSSKNWLENYFDSRINNYRLWLAQWTDKVTFKGKYEMWQYASDGHLLGFGSQNFDVNYSYINYPALIKKLGYNKL